MAKLNISVDPVFSWIQKNPWKVGSLIIGLFALWFVLQGVDIYKQNQTFRVAIGHRDIAAAKLQAFSSKHQQQMLKTASQFNSNINLLDKDSINSVFKKSIDDAELVELYDLGIADGYKDIVKFGTGKLAILESAIISPQVSFRIISVGGQQKIAIAKLIGTEANSALVYVQIPITTLDNIQPQSPSDEIYLSLRQGQVDLLKYGNVEFAITAEANAKIIEGTPWRLVASTALPEKGIYELGGIAELILGLSLLVLAVAIAYAPVIIKNRSRLAGIEPDSQSDLTLHEMQSQGVIKPDESNPAPVLNIKDFAYPKVPLERSIFKAYDIRGIVGSTLDAGIARLIGEVIGTILVEKKLKGIVVGYDGRLSSPSLSAGLIEGLIATGSAVLNIGQVPTPLVYFATHNSDFTSGVSITGSHNPPDYNGFKIVIDGHTLSGDEITDIYERIAENKIIKSQVEGIIIVKDIAHEYIQYITNDIQIDRPLKVVIDCGNGVPGAVAPDVMTAIGANVVEAIYCDVDGTFPNHHPDPSDPDNLIDLIKMVKVHGADIGLAFDGDGDRLGVVTGQGDIIYPDKLLMLFAEDVLHRNPGAAIIYDVKCTGALQGHILRNGGSPVMWKTGHSLIKAKMKETQAEFAGEMSGHFFFAERWFGFDDGIYAAARLLEILAAAPEGIQAKFDALPKSFSTPELKVEMTEGEQHDFIEKFVEQASFEGARINTIDGVRADWSYGWGLVRASNTTPVLVLRFEADNEENLANIKKQFRDQILSVQENLYLPF